MNALAYSVLRSLPADGPVEKFIATKLTSFYESQWTPPFTKRELLEALGIPPNTGRRPLNNLMHEQLVEATQRHGHHGPSRYSFQFRPEIAFPGGYDGSSTSLHQSKIAQLLEWNESPREHRAHQLTIPQRVLLMLLLASATRSGVVESLSQNHLARQMGKKSQHVRYGCNNLKRYGYIRCTIAGGKFERLLGTRTNIYFLELHHDAYGDQKSGGLTVILKRGARTPTQEALNKNRHLKRTRSAKKTKLKDTDDLNRPAIQLAEILDTKRRTPRSRYTRAKTGEIHQLLRLIDRLAEWTLLHYADKIDASLPCNLIRTIYKAIGSDLGPSDEEAIDYTTLPEKYIEPIKDASKWTTYEEVVDEFIMPESDDITDPRTAAQAYLVVCVIHRAKTALSAFRKIDKTITPDTEYLILPYSNVTGINIAICVESYPASPDSRHHDIWVYPPDPDDPICTFDDLTTGLLEATSLRTLPLESPCLKKPSKLRNIKNRN